VFLLEVFTQSVLWFVVAWMEVVQVSLRPHGEPSQET